jgi:uncharacterized protein
VRRDDVGPDARAVLSLLREHRADLRRFGIRRCGLFGSFVRDRAQPQSDVDLLIEFAPGQKSVDHFMQAAFYLDDLLGRKVELVTRESLSPHIGRHILQDVDYAALDD